MDNDKATAIREARAQLRARGEPDSMNRVVAIVRSSKRTVQKYWAVTAPETAPAEASPVPPGPAPVPAPEPPAFTLENLRLLYADRLHSPWPGGICPPLETYPLLCELWRECEAVIAAANREQRRLQNALGQQPSWAPEPPELRAVELRRGTAVVMLNSIAADQGLLEDRARRAGITLPE